MSANKHFNPTVVRREPKVSPADTIARDVEDFLARGGRIQVIPAGEARFPLKHITEDDGFRPARGIDGRKVRSGAE